MTTVSYGNDPSCESRFGVGVLRGSDRLAREDEERREYLARAAFAVREPEPEPVRQRAYVGREGSRKLDPRMVREVRAALAAGTPLREIAAWSGLSRPALANIRDGKTYREVG
jgi:hypothetical protein